MDLFKKGYKRALEDLYLDGVLSENEFKKRVEKIPNAPNSNSAPIPSEESPKVVRPKASITLHATNDNFVIRENSSAFSSLSSTIPTYKICLIGDGSVGKTTLVKRLQTGEFETKYFPTIGASVQTLIFMTNTGPIKVEVWDTAGQDRFKGLQEGLYLTADAFIMMFGVNDRMSYKNLPRWYEEVRKQSEKPIVLVGTKCETTARTIKPKTIIFHRKKGLQYYEVSTKVPYNIEKPFLHILRTLTKNPNLSFASSTTADSLPEIPLNNETIEQYDDELKKAAEYHLPEEDEE